MDIRVTEIGEVNVAPFFIKVPRAGTWKVEIREGVVTWTDMHTGETFETEASYT